MGIVDCFCSNPGFIHNELFKHVLQYVSDTLELGLTFVREVDILNNVVGYTASNFVESKNRSKIY